MKSFRKNMFGFAHHALLGVAVIAVIVFVGVKVLTATHAQTVIDNSSESDTQQVDDLKGNPIADFSSSAASSSAQSPLNESTDSIRVASSGHSGDPQCHDDGGIHCWYYAIALQENITARGASVVLSQATPTLGKHDGHTLMELAMYNAKGDSLELGWTRDRKLYADTNPRLFIYHRVTLNGHQKGYYSTKKTPHGFKENTSAPVRVGEAVTAETTAKFQINYTSGQWQFRYNGNLLGYFPDSIWDNNAGNSTFKQIRGVQTYGEVVVPDCEYFPNSQMGTGKYAQKSGAAIIKNYTLIGSDDTEKLTPLPSSDPHAYNRANQTSTGMNVGGPGYPLAKYDPCTGT